MMICGSEAQTTRRKAPGDGQTGVLGSSHFGEIIGQAETTKIKIAFSMTRVPLQGRQSGTIGNAREY